MAVRQVRLRSNQAESDYRPRRAAYDLKKLRAKNIVQRIGQTRRYQSTSSGLRAMVALVVLRSKAIKPLLAAAQRRRKSRGAQNPDPSISTTKPFARPCKGSSRNRGWPHETSTIIFPKFFAKRLTKFNEPDSQTPEAGSNESKNSECHLVHR